LEKIALLFEGLACAHKYLMQVFIDSPTGHITVQLFDVPVVKRWFLHFRNLVNGRDYHSAGITMLDSTLYLTRRYCKDRMDGLWQGIREDLAVLESRGFCIPFRIPHSFDYSQHTLNRLHRFFTLNAIWLHEKRPTNPFDPDFQLPDDFPFWEWHGLIDPINRKVHQLEAYTNPTENRRFVYDQFPVRDMHFCPRVEDPRNLFAISHSEYQHNHRFLEYDRYEHLMLLDASILGKSYLQSFCDDDDPNQEDCTGRQVSHGGFFITTDQNRRSIYASTQFARWCRSHGLDPRAVPHEFVLGYVKSRSCSLSDMVPNDQFRVKFQKWPTLWDSPQV